MITDGDTNLLYLAGCLPERHPVFFGRLERSLLDCNISYGFLPHTKDIWARDYMPVQATKTKFVQFVYNPDYLRKEKKWQKTISDVNTICSAIELSPLKSKIVLDGGNVVRGNDKIILTDKVFNENPFIPREKLIRELERLLEVDTIVIIPQDPSDFTGHADGMVRFFENDTVLVNDYNRDKTGFRDAFHQALHKARLKTVAIPYNPYGNKSDDDATGTYINYLQMKEILVVPVYGLKEDESVVREMENLFAGHTVVAVNSNEIAAEGGILNCISWNIVN